MLVVSRRNLLALLVKLDGHPSDSFCMIGGGSEAPGFFLKAEPDEVHYAYRPFGLMHPSTERAMKDGHNEDSD